MNDDMTKRLEALMDYIGERAKQADGFVMEQAPLVAREIVAWTMWYSLVWVGVGVVLVAAAVVLWRVGVVKDREARVAEAKKPRREWGGGEYDGSWLALAFAGPIVCGMAAAACIGVAGSTVIKSVVAPRLVVVDYVKSLGRR